MSPIAPLVGIKGPTPCHVSRGQFVAPVLGQFSPYSSAAVTVFTLFVCVWSLRLAITSSFHEANNGKMLFIFDFDAPTVLPATARVLNFKCSQLLSIFQRNMRPSNLFARGSEWLE